LRTLVYQDVLDDSPRGKYRPLAFQVKFGLFFTEEGSLYKADSLRCEEEMNQVPLNTEMHLIDSDTFAWVVVSYPALDVLADCTDRNGGCILKI